MPVDVCVDVAVAAERRQLFFRMIGEKPSFCWGALSAFTALQNVGLLRLLSVDRVLDPHVYAWLCDPVGAHGDLAAIVQRLGVPAIRAAADAHDPLMLCCNCFRAGQRILALVDGNGGSGVVFPSRELLRFEMVFVGTVARMAACGIGFSADAFRETREKLHLKLTKLSERVYAARQVSVHVHSGIALCVYASHA